MDPQKLLPHERILREFKDNPETEYTSGYFIAKGMSDLDVSSSLRHLTNEGVVEARYDPKKEEIFYKLKIKVEEKKPDPRKLRTRMDFD